MTSAAAISRALKGHRHGGGFLCRCPVASHGNGRGDRNPSLSIRDGDDGRLLVHCFAGCDPLDVLDALRQRGLLDNDRALRERRAPSRCEAMAEPPQTPNPLALDLWRQGEPIAGTLAQTYLRNRGLRVDAMPSLRFLPRDAHGFMSRVPFNALIAAVQAPDRQIIAAQLTWIAPDGCGKAKTDPPRLTIGALRDGAVRLGAAGEELGIAEGIETAIAAMQLHSVPVWACLGAKRMASIKIPHTVKRLRIFADADTPGQEAARDAADAHINLRRFIHTPQHPHGDFADVAAARSKKGATQ
ncbi:MAG: toprim domain-containing protein [Methylocystis sp.]|uniref:DUF7146 domain-containing protein n=1 Tax=Methylocystis sp. TaxID=1911079 RepID=UPI00393E6464